MALIEADKTGLCLYTKEEAESFKRIYECTLEEFIGDNKPDYELELTDEHTIVFVENTDSNKRPIEIKSLLIPEGARFKYKATLFIYGHVVVIKLVYENGNVKYIINDNEPWPMSFDDGIDAGDLLFCAEEEGYTKEDALNYIEDWIKVNHNYKFKLNKNKLIIMEGL